jgi:hypothetical protein
MTRDSQLGRHRASCAKRVIFCHKRASQIQRSKRFRLASAPWSIQGFRTTACWESTSSAKIPGGCPTERFRCVGGWRHNKRSYVAWTNRKVQSCSAGITPPRHFPYSSASNSFPRFPYTWNLFYLFELDNSVTRDKMAPTSTGTFKPLRHRSGTMRERLHSYTQRTLGAGGSYNDAVSTYWY